MIPEDVEITTLLSILIGIVLTFLLGVSWVQIRAEHRIGELERTRLVNQMMVDNSVGRLEKKADELVIEAWRLRQ